MCILHFSLIKYILYEICIVNYLVSKLLQPRLEAIHPFWATSVGMNEVQTCRQGNFAVQMLSGKKHSI